MEKILLLFLVVASSCCFEPAFVKGEVKIMSWNVQNLFDDVDNGEEYSEFSVSGGDWNTELYEKRLSLLSGIVSLNSPDIVGLQEVEGEAVIRHLVNGYLKEYKYWAVTETDSAVEVGFISKYPIKRSGVIKVGDVKSGLRDILEVTVDIDGNEIVLFNNHWKSKSRGGGESLRIKSAKALKKRVIMLKGREFVVLGDLNENYNEYQRVNKGYKTALMLNEEGEGLSVSSSKVPKAGFLYTPWEHSSSPGSYMYKGEWETIDHFLLSPKLLDKDNFHFKGFMVDSRSSLFLNDDEIYGWKTYLGAGYSDHLPILLTLEIEGGVKTTLE